VISSNDLAAQRQGLITAVNQPMGYYGDDSTTQATRNLYKSQLAALG